MSIPTNLNVAAVSYNGTPIPLAGGSATLQSKSKSYTPTESQQSETISADTGYDGLSSVSVSVGAISSSYVGSGITRRSSTDLTASGATVTAPAGYYSSSASKSVSSMTLPTSASGTSSGTSKATISRSTSDQYINIPTGYNSSAAFYKVSAVANGTEGTPTATKGTVSNHSISVTPSVTNSAGYISGGTKTGTAVSVTASELASGNKEITSNGTNIDVVGYSTVSVNVSGGGGSSMYTGTYSPETSPTENVAFACAGATNFLFRIADDATIDTTTGHAFVYLLYADTSKTSMFGSNNGGTAIANGADRYATGARNGTALGVQFTTNGVELIYYNSTSYRWIQAGLTYNWYAW